MIKLEQIIFGFLTCLLFASCEFKSEVLKVDAPAVGLCFVPFDVSTSAPMNKVNFAQSCTDIGEINIQDRRYLEVLSLIKKSKPGPFLDGGIRVKITLPDATSIYIDDAGGVVIGTSQVKLDEDSFFKIKEIFNKIARGKGVSIDE
jgi:hypothetical protein